MNEKLHSAAARYSELLRRHEHMLRWLCLRRAYADIELSDDYFQEVCLFLWRQLPSLPSGMPYKQERLYVKKLAVSALSRCSRKNRPDVRCIDPEMIIAVDQHAKENEQLLNDLVDALPGDDRLVVGLYRAGYEVAGIALYLGISPNAASHRLRRAIARMQSIMEKENNI